MNIRKKKENGFLGFSSLLPIFEFFLCVSKINVELIPGKKFAKFILI